MLVFWEHGYEHTNLEQLLDAMQISPGSFYNSFESKKQLYRTCIDHYNQHVTAGRVALMLNQQTHIREGTRAFFRRIISEMGQKEMPRGCLMTNSVCDEVLAEPDLNEHVLGAMRGFQETIRRRLQTAVEAGELPANCDSATLAGVLIGWIQAITKGSQMGKSARQLQKETDLMLNGLGF